LWIRAGAKPDPKNRDGVTPLKHGIALRQCEDHGPVAQGRRGPTAERSGW
jgi:hypothetical protein